MRSATHQTPSSPSTQISNRNTPAFKICRNSHTTQDITFSNRNITSGAAISFSSPIPSSSPSPVSHVPSSLVSFPAISTPYTIKSRNQPNSMKTNDGPDFYLEHLDTLRITNSPAHPQLSQEFGALPNAPYKGRVSTPPPACGFRQGTVSTVPHRGADRSVAFPPSLPATRPPDFSISNRKRQELETMPKPMKTKVWCAV
jgi:hypothetical protein